MIKKFRKMTTLALVLALILAVSASVFAINSYHNGWFASDGTSVEYYAEIDSNSTHGFILSESNQGEVNVDLTYYYGNPDDAYVDYLGWTDINYAFVSTEDIDCFNLLEADYSFWAYVPAGEGEYFESDTVVLYPTNP